MVDRCRCGEVGSDVPASDLGSEEGANTPGVVGGRSVTGSVDSVELIKVKAIGPLGFCGEGVLEARNRTTGWTSVDNGCYFVRQKGCYPREKVTNRFKAERVHSPIACSFAPSPRYDCADLAVLHMD